MRLLCLGDSLTKGFDVPRSDRWLHKISLELPTLQIRNLASCGLSATEFSYHLDRALAEEIPDALFLMGGTNDFLLGSKPYLVSTDIFTAAANAQALNIKIYLGIPPLTTKDSVLYGWQTLDTWTATNAALLKFSSYLKKEALKKKYEIIDFQTAFENALEKGKKIYADGVHPNQCGYEIFYQIALKIWR